MMGFQLLVKKGHRQKGSPLENDMSGFLKRDKPRHRRSFSLFDLTLLHPNRKKKKAQHKRTQSHGTFLTHDLTIETEESYSGEEKSELNYIGEIYESDELLSPLHMIHHGKSPTESAFEHDVTLEETTASILKARGSDDSLCFSKDGLSCIIEEGSSRETESERSIGMISSRESKPDPTSPSSCHSNDIYSTQRQSNPMDYFIHKTLGKETPRSRMDSHFKLSSQMDAVSPSMIQMDGSILSPSGGSWIDLRNDPLLRRELIMNRSKRSSNPSDGIKSSSTKRTEYISLLEECNGQQAPMICNHNSSNNDSIPPHIEPRSEEDSFFAGFLNEGERIDSSFSSISRSSSDGSSDRKELLSAWKQSTRKTHRRSSRRWSDFFSQSMDSPGLLPAQENAGLQNLVSGEVKCWELGNGAVRMEI